MPKPRKSGKLSVAFLFDDTLDSTAGVAQYVKTLGAWLQRQGHQVSYFVGQTEITEWSGGRVYSLSSNINVRFNGNRLTMPRPTANRRQITNLLAEIKPDILHVQVPYSPFMAQRVINRSSINAGIVGSFHVLPNSWLAAIGTRLLKPIYGRSLKRIDYMTATSSAAAKFAKQALALQTTVLPNVVELSTFQTGSHSPDRSRNRIVFLGRLVKRKGTHQLLEAFRLLNKSMPAVELVMAGAGPELSSLQRYVNEHKLSHKISFHGFVDESAKAQLLASADVACFPSLGGESFGISLIEAMASDAGVVLGGDNPGYRSILGQKPELLVEPTDTKAFAKKLKLLLTDKALRRELKRWQSSAVKQYDVEIVGPKVLELYHQAIAKRHSSR